MEFWHRCPYPVGNAYSADLHLALVKGRDMSVIESPPEDRLPVETYVAEYDDGMVKEAIEREIRRGGRIYYVHNRIEALDRIAHRLREMIPGLSIGVAHGRMTEDELEEVMVGFYQGDYDVLLSTTIIENGLDVPLCQYNHHRWGRKLWPFPALSDARTGGTLFAPCLCVFSL